MVALKRFSVDFAKLLVHTLCPSPGKTVVAERTIEAEIESAVKVSEDIFCIVKYIKIKM